MPRTAKGSEGSTAIEALDGQTGERARGKGSRAGRGVLPGVLGRLDPLLLLAAALFVASTIVRTLVADFPKSADVMPDELRYLDLARSLAFDGTLTIRGEASSFQKILYPLALLPAMAFHDAQMQVHVIALLNSLYASSAVFPAYVLAKRIVPGRLPQAFCLVLALLTPDICYSMTFMSECLYLPLALWLLVVLWDALERPGARGLASALAGGALCYVTYLCKEVALAFVIVMALMLAARTVRLAWRAWRKRRRAGVGVRGDVLSFVSEFGDPLARLALFLIGFLLLFVALKLTLFAGMLNSYNQSSLDVLESLYVDVFALYAVGQNAVYFLLGFAFFPLVLPFVSFRHFDRGERAFLMLLFGVFLVGFLTVVYTISMREDAGHVALRQHVRYVAPLMVPLAFFVVKQAVAGPRPRWGETLGRGHVLTAVLAAFCAGVLAVFGTANLSQGLDNASLHLFRAICDVDWTIPAEKFSASAGALSAISDEDEAVLEINAAVWLARAGIVAVAVAGCALFFARGRAGRAGGVFAVAVTAALFAGNTVACTVHNWDSYGTDVENIQEAQAVNGILETAPADARVLIVYDDANTAANNLVTTYVPDWRHTYRYVSDEDLAEALEEDGTVPPTILDADAPNAELFAGAAGADEAAGGPSEPGGLAVPVYVLLNESQNLRVSSEGAVEISHEPQDNYVLYRVPAGEPLKFDVTETSDRAR